MPLMSNPTSVNGQESDNSPINLAHFPYRPIKQEGRQGMLQETLGNGGYLNNIPVSGHGISQQQPPAHGQPQQPNSSSSSKKEKSKKSVDNATKKKKTR